MNATEKIELKWGTEPIAYSDPEIGNAEIIVRGVCNYSVNETNKTTKEIEQELIDTIKECIKEIIAENENISFSKFSIILTTKLPDLITKKETSVTICDFKVLGVDYTDNSKDLLKEKIESKTNKIVQTDIGAKNGQDKCPKCGSTDISTNIATGKLKCHFCRAEFEPEKVQGFVEDISTLNGQILGSGAQNIAEDATDVITLKCTSCGAEVVIDTASATQARCHWCRNTLSLNEQLPNGAIPDVVLPFGVSRDIARAEIEKFVFKRKFFAHPKFRQEFTTNNIMGVYFPYMLVDVNSHAKLVGEGEHQTRVYHRTHDDRTETYYDADLYHIEREFDLTINGLSVESSSKRLDTSSSTETNNIINSIMPFDIENCVKYNANYLRGYTSEKRDTNVEQLKNIVDLQAKDIARFAANDTLTNYDRGVAWANEQLDIKGQQWQAAYLPVWLYSYLQVKNNKKILHYVAVNARTKETMGSIPIHMPKLLLIAFLVEILGVLGVVFVDWDYDWLFLTLGIIFFVIMYARYRNAGARHTYELETKRQMTNLRKVDNFIKSKKGLSNPTMNGANNKIVYGHNNSKNILNKVNQSIGNNINSIKIDTSVNNIVKKKGEK